MEQVFIDILNMSLTAGIAVLAVLVIRLLLKKAPKIFSYALWAVVLFRLLCPFSFSSAVSLLGALSAPDAQQGKIEYIPENIGYMEQPMVNLPIPAVENAINESMPAANTAASVNPMQIVIWIGAYIWLFGAGAVAVYGIIKYIKLRRRLKTAVCESGNIFVSPDIETPFVCGIVVPKIYLPSTLGDEEKRYILLHEQIHIKRGDHIFRLAGFVALCLHWFNPLVWLAFFISGRDMEMSCDEAVIRKIGNGVKKEYSASLLSLASGRKIVLGIPLAFGEGDTKSRIKNILKFKKPAKIATAVIAIACVIAVIALVANPKRTEDGGASLNSAEDGGNSLSSKDASEIADSLVQVIYYGVVLEVEIDGNRQMIVKIPGCDMEIPEADEIYPYIEIEDFSGLKAGDLVKITFPKGEDIGIGEGYPGVFSFSKSERAKAESIVVMGEGFLMWPVGSDRYQFTPDIPYVSAVPRYMFTVPWGLARDAEVGDTLEIYYYNEDVSFRYDKEESEWEKTLLAVTTVLDVDVDNYDIWVELSREEVETFLFNFGNGITCNVIKQSEMENSDGQTGENEQNGESGQVGENEQTGENGQYIASTDEDVVELTREHLLRGAIVDGVYRGYVRSISRSARGIDRYIVDDMEDGEELLFLAFADDCHFLINKKMNTLSYEETSFDEFADFAVELFAYLNPPMILTFEDGLITEAVVENYYGSGIAFDMEYPEDYWYEDMQEITSLSGEEMLDTYYELESSWVADIGDGTGLEQIQVYTGNIGDGESGFVFFNNAQGRLLCSLFAHRARAGWNNIYLGERGGVEFIMTVHIENRDNFGNYSYHVFRLAEDGGIKMIAGSSFDWDDDRIPYDDELFREWAEDMNGYLADSRLLLSTQEGELNTEHVSEADKYNYETLTLR
ncbi:MAG: M56 family metallopeptidase [Clostridiales bacterium]|nr:M56 family metallopeptidase [Clostridiales bacterium]